MPHTVVGSEQRRRRGRPLSSRDRTFTSAPTQIVNVPYAYCGGGTVHRLSCSRSHSVRAGSVTAVRIPLCGDTCAQMRKASCSVRPCRLAVKNVPSYAAPRSATGVSPVLSTARFALPSPFSAIDWLHTPHGSQARPARFLVGSARSMAYVRAVAVEPQRQKRALMATSPQTSSHSGSI